MNLCWSVLFSLCWHFWNDKIKLINLICFFRDFLFYISSPRIAGTNPNCAIKTEIVCNRETPSVSFQLIPSVQGEENFLTLFVSNLRLSILEAEKIKTIKIDSDNLTVLELLKVTNEQVSIRAPKEEPVKTIKTKSEKKSAAGGVRRK